jgi:hypothetical protein
LRNGCFAPEADLPLKSAFDPRLCENSYAQLARRISVPIFVAVKTNCTGSFCRKKAIEKTILGASKALATQRVRSRNREIGAARSHRKRQGKTNTGDQFPAEYKNNIFIAENQLPLNELVGLAGERRNVLGLRNAAFAVAADADLGLFFAISAPTSPRSRRPRQSPTTIPIYQGKAQRPPRAAAVHHATPTPMREPRRSPASPASARITCSRRCTTTSRACGPAAAWRRWRRSPIP